MSPTSVRSDIDRPANVESGGAREELGELAGARGDRRRYDRGFQPAIDAGHLTMRQAIERGNRNHYAKVLAVRHDLSLDLAYQVADGRRSLPSATHKARPATARTARRTIKVDERLLVWALTLVALFLVVGYAIDLLKDRASTKEALSVVRGRTDPAISVGLPVVPAIVKTDALDRAVRVEGPDPASVLVAFCGTLPESQWLEPTEITSTIPPNWLARFGFFTDRRTGVTRTILITHDNRKQRWVTGSGTEPIPIGTAPSLPASAMRTSIGSRR